MKSQVVLVLVLMLLLLLVTKEPVMSDRSWTAQAFLSLFHLPVQEIE
jgi:hypothetical protein